MRWRWPLVKRSTLEREQAATKRLRGRIFYLRDSLKNAKERIGYNVSIPDNAAAFHVLDMALRRDFEAESAP